MGKHTNFMVYLLAILATGTLSAPAQAIRIKELCEIQGARGNILRGTGIVVGLAGTGDKAPAAIRHLERMLDRLEVEIDSLAELQSNNIAIVSVTATIPAFAKEGTRIDVQVSSIYDSESIEGGTLLETLLSGVDDEVYAVAQGPVSTGGFNADATGASVRKNHVTAGRIPMGAFVEREIPSTITDGERIMLLLKRPDFATANNIQKAINAEFGASSASALGAGTINVIIPSERRSGLVSFIAELQEIDVQSDVVARVVINERTGTIVIGGRVMIRPCQVAHGNLTIEISSEPIISQPLAFSPGQTVVTESAQVNVEEELGYLMPVQGVSAADVANTLNKLKVSPRDMISIFQALRQAGSLEADLEIM